MTEHTAKPAYDAGRRFRWLGVGIIIAIAAWTAGWYWLADRLDAETARLVARQGERGLAIDCADRKVSGYPFRLEIRCTSFDLAQPSEGLSIDAGGFRSAAQVYEPNRVYAELDAPVAVQSAAVGPMRLDWSLAQATATLASPLPKRGSVVVENIALALGSLEKALTATHAEAHMRTAGADLDLAMRYEGLVVDERLSDGRKLPVLGGDADISVKNGVALAVNGTDTLRGVSGEIRRMALLLTIDRGFLVSGPFEIDRKGRLNAKLQATLVDPDGLADAIRTVFPEFAGQVGLMTALPTTPGPDGTPETTIPINIKDGRVVVGFVPVGEIPRFD